MPARPPAARILSSNAPDNTTTATTAAVTGNGEEDGEEDQNQPFVPHPFFLHGSAKPGSDASSVPATAGAAAAAADVGPSTPSTVAVNSVVAASDSAQTPVSVGFEYSSFERAGKQFTKQTFATPRHGSSKHDRVGMRKVAATTGRRGGKHRRKFLIKDSGAFAAAFPDKRVVEIGKGTDLTAITAPAPAPPEMYVAEVQTTPTVAVTVAEEHDSLATDDDTAEAMESMSAGPRRGRFVS